MELTDLTLEQIDQLLIDAEDFGSSLPDGLQFKSGSTTFQIKDIVQYFVDEMFDEVHRRNDDSTKTCPNGHKLSGKYAKFNVCPVCRDIDTKKRAQRIFDARGDIRKL